MAEAFAVQSTHKTILENVDCLREQRAALVDDISRMNSELIALSSRLEGVRKHHDTEISGALSQKSSLQQELTSLRQELARLKSNNDGLEPIKRHLEASIADRQTQLERLDRRLAEQRLVAEEYTNQIEQARQLWTEIVQRAVDETKRLELAKAEADRLEPLKFQRREVEEHLTQLQKQDAELQHSMKQSTADEARLRRSVAALNADLESKKRMELDLLRRQNESELSLSKSRLERENTEARNAELKAENTSLEEKIAKQLERKRLTEDEIHNQQTRLKGILATIEPLKDDLARRELEHRQTIDDINAARLGLREIISAIADREKKLDVLQGKHDALQTDIRQLEAVQQTLTAQLTETRTLLSDEKQQLLATRADTEQTRKQLGTVNTEVLRLRELNGHLNDENQILQGILGKTQSTLADTQRALNQTIEAHENTLKAQANLDQEVNGARENLRILAEETLHTQNEKKKQLTEMARLTDEERQLQTLLKTGLEELRGNQQAIADAQTKLNALTEAHKELEARRITLAKSVEHLGNQEGNLLIVQNRIREVQKKEEILKTSYANAVRIEKAIEARLVTLEDQENGLLTRIDALRLQLAEIEKAQAQVHLKKDESAKELENLQTQTADALQKRNNALDLLRNENSALNEIREQLSTLENLKETKMKELEDLRNRSLDLEIKRSQAQPTDNGTRTTSAQVRAEAERTLETLRSQLDSLGSGKKSA